MPSSYPFPSVAALALSLYSSARRVEPLPMVTEYNQFEMVRIVPMMYQDASGKINWNEGL